MRVRLESVADWLAASDPSGTAARTHLGSHPLLASSDEGEGAGSDTFDLPWELRNHGVGWVRGVERLRNGGVQRNPVFLMPIAAATPSCSV